MRDEEHEARRPGFFVAGIAYALLTIALTWPLVVRLSEVVPGDLGDPLLSIWTLWWNAHVTPFTATWWDGMAFFPAHHILALSDHRVGLGLIATPVMWLGASPVTAYNLVFLSSFFLSAIAAYALCWSMTRNRAAALAGGLVFGFNPYRADHLAHLELLASYWLPIVLFALHQWARTQRRTWLALLAVALLMQALSSGYYYVFCMVLVGLWLIWFTPRHLALGDYARLGVALLLPLLAITPMLLVYHDAHAAFGLSRSITEIEQLSADLRSLVTAPRLMAWWPSPEAWQRPEAALMPGTVAVAIIVAALLRGPRGVRDDAVRSSLDRVRLGLLFGTCVAAVIAAVPLLFGPVAFALAGARVSISEPYKPLTIAALLGSGWLLATTRVREAWKSQSPLAFYVLATLAMWLLAMGPTVRAFGQRVLYKAPYAWLMLLPGFRDEFRAPARFGMLAALTLGVAVAVAFVRLVESRRMATRLAAGWLLAAAIMTESWLQPIPLHTPPAPLDVPAAVPADAAVLEWPLGHEDATAMYRSIAHGRRTVNGMSGYSPPHYHVLHEALREGRFGALSALARHAPIALFVPRGDDTVTAALTANGIATALTSTATHDVLLVPATPKPPFGTAIAQSPRVQRLDPDADGTALTRTTDDDRYTAWSTPEPQHGGEQLLIDLGATASVMGITTTLGARPWTYPRELSVAVSVDGSDWTEVWRGDVSEKAVATAIDDPRDVGLTFTFPMQAARYLRLTQFGRADAPWTIAELRVVGTTNTKLTK